jgi:uncharacterized zinc-type alcohol dehydrogenase-like protein
MADTFHAWAAPKAGAPLEAFEFEPQPLGPEDVEIVVESCGICHSDLSMIDNEWGQSTYPLVAGHEIVGVIDRAGDHVKGVQPGDRVGLGWFARSCMSCRPCLSGHHNLCGEVEQTIVGRHGGFADRVRCHWSWAVPIPDGVDPAKAGPLFCGGTTVFGPIAHFGVRPTDRVGVVGIGGLGHLALQFLDKWGCHVTAFTSSDSKIDEARRLGADAVVNSRDDDAMKSIAGSLDFLLVTVNVPLNWESYLSALRPDGRLHFVGAVLEPIAVQAFSLIAQRKTISGSPLGSPATVADMLEFCARHEISPQTEHYSFAEINEALDHLRAGKARYRVILS